MVRPYSYRHNILSLQKLSSSKEINNKNNNNNQYSSFTSSTNAAATILENNPKKKAGQDGYSLLRQPLHRETWDASQDPTFAVPKSLNDDDHKTTKNHVPDMEWWTSRQEQTKMKKTTNMDDSKSDTKQSKVLSTNNDLMEAPESLNLFQRSFDTLDFPYVLKALRKECLTMPAKKLVDEAEISNNMTTNGKSKSNHNNSSNSNNNQTRSPSSILPLSSATRPLIANSPEQVQDHYRAVQEMQWLLDPQQNLGNAHHYYTSRRGYQVSLGQGSPPPTLDSHLFDLDSILQLVDNGQILKGPELLDVSVMMNCMEELQRWSQGLEQYATVTTLQYPNNDGINQQQQTFVQLPAMVREMKLNTTLQKLLEDAFDETGKLSGKTFPILGELRAKIRALKADILQTLDSIVQLPSIKSKLALESGGPLYSEVSSTTGGGGRLVLPIDPKYASQLGIVHDSSRSGKTVYVEPSEIVGPTNELRQIERELEIEESRVWKSLTEQVWNNRYDLQISVQAVAQLDLCLARCQLGQKWHGVIPNVRNEGVIDLKDAKHPVLMLRQVDNVVGSEISLGGNNNQGLILTGPNSGGKTVILKLLGLMALMSRSGIPIPAAPGSFTEEGGYHPRVDFFNPVLADIGDIQSVDGDLSTFSGHMLVCREVLALAKSGKNALVLMDELGSGTDPAQGVAIAQALLEALLETGCRVAITTHYMALKQLASSDDRFSVAGMQFVGGRPTYKLLPGVVGESYALTVAERLKLPKSVLDRANELLDSETRQLGDLIRDMEDQKAIIDQQVAEIEEKKKDIAAMEMKMKEERDRLEKKMLTARREEAKKFAKKLEEKEQILEDVLNKLKSNPSRKLLVKSWEDIKFVKRDAINEAENVPSVLKAKQKKADEIEGARQELVPLAEIRDRPTLQAGDVITVCMPGSLFGRQATVIRDQGKQLQVQVSGLNMSLKNTDLSMIPANPDMISKPEKPIRDSEGKFARLSKSTERALMIENTAPVGSTLPKSENNSKASKSPSIRLDFNTVDVRGCNLEEAKEKVKHKISKMVMRGQNTVYVLHGHGSGGVLKSKLRGWLKSENTLLRSWAPADQSDGGDACTRLEIN